jgi:hypothetical protein
MGHDLPGLPWHDDDMTWGSLGTKPGRPRTPHGADEHVSMFGLATEESSEESSEDGLP